MYILFEFLTHLDPYHPNKYIWKALLFDFIRQSIQQLLMKNDDLIAHPIDGIYG